MGGQSSGKNKEIAAIAKDLQAHKGACLVIAGDYQPPAVHALAHAMNQALGNVGKTVRYTDSIEGNPTDHQDSLRQLVADMNAGKVETLFILGGNPVYSAPADLDFAAALRKVSWKAYLGLYPGRDRQAMRAGRFRKRTIWNPGATFAPSTEPSASSSR